MFHGRFDIKIHSQIKDIYAYIRIYSIFTHVFVTIAIKITNKLTDIP